MHSRFLESIAITLQRQSMPTHELLHVRQSGKTQILLPPTLAGDDGVCHPLWQVMMVSATHSGR
jgi:hypothetical protein